MNDNFPDVNQLRLATAPVSGFTSDISRPKHSGPAKIIGEFLKGPIPLDWLGRAAALPGKSPLATALAIMFEVGRRKSHQIRLTTAILERFGVNRKAKYRALKKLEAENLISVARTPGKNPTVNVLAVAKHVGSQGASNAA